jgi:S-DNA-T family DNA segregation ATPase FtsK/SpoIIIE
LKPTISHSSDINLEPALKPLAAGYCCQKWNFIWRFICYRNCTWRGFIEENLASKLVADFGLFDPTLDLSNYKYPTIDL